MGKNSGKGKLIYFTKEEWSLIEEKSREANLNTTSYIRNSALSRLVIVYDFETIDKLVFEINKIGNNINQIAKKVNTNNIVLKHDIEIVKKGLVKIWQLLNRNLFTKI